MSMSSAPRVQKHRAQLRAAGLRPIQIWVPDTRRPGFAEECRRQSLSLRDDAQEREIGEWLEKVGDTDGWERGAAISLSSPCKGISASRAQRL
jgi:hypothetical protein